MQVALLDKDGDSLAVIYNLLIRSVLSGYTPILVTGERGFPYYSFLKYGKFYRLPVSVTGELLCVSAVNMYHLEGIISEIKALEHENSLLPVFMDFSRHYLDEKVPSEIAEFLFRRDYSKIEKLDLYSRGGIFFYESGTVRESQRIMRFRSILQFHSYAYLELENCSKKSMYFNKKQREKIHGSTDPAILGLCKKFVRGMEDVQASVTQGRPDFFRGIFQGSQSEYSSGERASLSFPDGDCSFYGGYRSLEKK